MEIRLQEASKQLSQHRLQIQSLTWIRVRRFAFFCGVCVCVSVIVLFISFYDFYGKSFVIRYFGDEFRVFLQQRHEYWIWHGDGWSASHTRPTYVFFGPFVNPHIAETKYDKVSQHSNSRGAISKSPRHWAPDESQHPKAHGIATKSKTVPRIVYLGHTSYQTPIISLDVWCIVPGRDTKLPVFWLLECSPCAMKA